MPRLKSVVSHPQHKVVTDVLREMGAPAQVKGYEALRQGILMVMDDPMIMRRMTKTLYPGVGKRINAKPEHVERAMRHAIEMMWTSGDEKGIQRIFGVKPDIYNKPSNSRFLAAVADYINVYRVVES